MPSHTTKERKKRSKRLSAFKGTSTLKANPKVLLRKKKKGSSHKK